VRCLGCLPLDIAAGSCVSCVSLAQCASRPAPATRCMQALTQQECVLRYELLPEIWGLAASCFWNAQSQCRPCGLTSQFTDGACTNEC
jgi:hypothetical protein